MMTEALPHNLERTVVILADREIVFRFFTDSARWSAWWGQGSTIDPKVGGEVYIRHPGGVEVRGEIIEIVEPERLVFTYGYVKGDPIPLGSSVVTIALEDHGDATRLVLSHAFADQPAREEHIQGWRYQLSLFSNLVTNEANARAAEAVDAWFAAWAEPDTSTREATLDRIATSSISFRDRFSTIDGMADLRPHLAALHRFMPGSKIQRDGDVRHSQGTVLADWVAHGGNGKEIGRGTNVFTFNGAARIESVVGFWGPASAQGSGVAGPQK